jgi:hypothetical protein
VIQIPKQEPMMAMTTMMVAMMMVVAQEIPVISETNLN